MKRRSPGLQNLVKTMSKASVVLIRENIIYSSVIKHILQGGYGEGKKVKLNTMSTAQLGKDKFCFCCSLPSVCIEKHSREHQLHTTPLPALEPLLSSKRDPYKVLLQHTTPDPLETAVPAVLKDKRANMIDKKPCRHLQM